MKPSPACIALIKQFEGCARKLPDGRFEAYPDPASGGDPWTIGWGSTGAGIARGVIWTQAMCDDRLDRDTKALGEKVSALLGPLPGTQHQFDALVSFAYNLGITNLQVSTLLKKHRHGDYEAAAAEFVKWNKAAGKVMSGLTRRREAEAELYREP